MSTRNFAAWKHGRTFQHGIPSQQSRKSNARTRITPNVATAKIAQRHRNNRVLARKGKAKYRAKKGLAHLQNVSYLALELQRLVSLLPRGRHFLLLSGLPTTGLALALQNGKDGK